MAIIISVRNDNFNNSRRSLSAARWFSFQIVCSVIFMYVVLGVTDTRMQFYPMTPTARWLLLDATDPLRCGRWLELPLSSPSTTSIAKCVTCCSSVDSVRRATIGSTLTRQSIVLSPSSEACLMVMVLLLPEPDDTAYCGRSTLSVGPSALLRTQLKGWPIISPASNPVHRENAALQNTIL